MTSLAQAVRQRRATAFADNQVTVLSLSSGLTLRLNPAPGRLQPLSGRRWETLSWPVIFAAIA